VPLNLSPGNAGATSTLTAEESAAAGAAPHQGRAYAYTFLFCSLLCLLPIWVFDYLPMVDLPQHAQQLIIWLHWDDPAYGYQQYFDLNWKTPYLLPNTVVYLLAQFLPAVAAFKVLISLGLLAIPLVARLLLRESGGNPWWVFPVFPIGFSFSFYWGFFNFILATPLTLLFLILAIRYSGEPTRARAVAIFLFAHVMFVGHALLYGLCGLVAGALVLLRAPSPRSAVVRLLPLAASLPIVLLWLSFTYGNEAETRSPPVWGHSLWRIPELFTQVLGMPIGRTALLSAATLVFLPFLLGARPSRRAFRWAPLAVVVTLFLVAPQKALGTSLLYTRFAVFALPTFLYALDQAPRPLLRWRYALGPLLAAAWLLSLSFRFWGFNLEMAGFNRVIAPMEHHRRVLYFYTVQNLSKFIPYPVFAYSGLWYQVDHGGMVDFSFAEFFPARFRYKPERRPPLPPLFRWRPWLFRWPENGGHLYDYYLVSSESDLGPAIFRGATEPIRLERQEGIWWLYRRGSEDSANSWLTPPPGGSGVHPPADSR
jgi:hypothetical protein